MNLSKIADEAQRAVKLGDALGKTDSEIHDDVQAVVGHLPVEQIEAVVRIVTADVAHSNANQS